MSALSLALLILSRSRASGARLNQVVLHSAVHFERFANRSMLPPISYFAHFPTRCLRQMLAISQISASNLFD